MTNDDRAHIFRLETLHLLEAQVSNGRGILHFPLARMHEHPNLISSYYKGPIVLPAVTNGQLRITITLLSDK